MCFRYRLFINNSWRNFFSSIFVTQITAPQYSTFMKILLTLIASLCLYGNILAQTTDHPSIEKVQIDYKIITSSTAQTASVVIPGINVQANTMVTLKNNSDVSKIYLKIKNSIAGVVIYDVSYSAGPNPVTDASGVTLYKKENNIITIINPAAILLNPYEYELSTEDSLGNKSIIYTTTQ